MASDAHTGEIGASIAFHLAERGARSVTVLDARRAGEGISSTSSALVRMHYTFEPEVHTWPCEAWSTSVTGRTAPAISLCLLRLRADRRPRRGPAFDPPARRERARLRSKRQRRCGAHDQRPHEQSPATRDHLR